MDTVPKDQSSSANPQSPPQTPPDSSPIQPGQFVVAGDDGVFKQPPSPKLPTQPIKPTQPIQPASPSLAGKQAAGFAELRQADEPSTPISQSSPEPQPTMPQEPPPPPLDLPTTLPISPPVDQSPLPQPETIQTMPPLQPPQVPSDQPDPTPFTPPQVALPSQPEGPSTINKLRIVVIASGILILLIVLGAVVWVFVLGNYRQKFEQTKSEIPSQEAAIEEPSPLPKRQIGGFGELPSATNLGQESTPSGQ